MRWSSYRQALPVSLSIQDGKQSKLNRHFLQPDQNRECPPYSGLLLHDLRSHGLTEPSKQPEYPVHGQAVLF